MNPVKQLVSDQRNGLLVVLRMSGEISRQVVSDSGQREWREYPISELPSRPVQIAVDHNSRLVALLQNGQVFQELPLQRGRWRHANWEEVAGPS